MKKIFFTLLVFFVIFKSCLSFAAESACARVSIEIAQELTLERIAFDAKLIIHNNLPDKDLENVRVDVTIQDTAGNIKNDIFYARVSSLSNIDDVTGQGSVSRNTSSEAHWLIIPSPGAGGDDPAGVAYFIGATLTYTINGQQEVLPINPDRITVRPTAQLYLDYFMPYAVLGDNPFTPQTEAPVPFPLAVRVLNDGYGPANKLKIDSAQPEIVANDQGLLVDFKLLGAAVNDSAVFPSLTVDMGDVPSKGGATGYWEMISTLSGRFEKFSATFSHDSELGGELTSLIKADPGTHYLTKRILVNLPERDGLLDFLADTDGDAEHLPDTIFESEYPDDATDLESTQTPVTVLFPVSAPDRPTVEEPQVSVSLALGGHEGGWIYSRMVDPSQGLLKLENVVRADGVALNPNNFWVAEGLDKDYKPTFTLQFVDYRASAVAPGMYTLVFTQPDEDVTAPTSTLVFDGPAVEGETTYLVPETRIVFTARDNEGGSGVEEMFRRLDESVEFTVAVPLSLGAGGYTLEYYSVDRAGNAEVAKNQPLVVDGSAPVWDSVPALSPTSFTPQAPSGVSNSQEVTLTFTASDEVPTLPVVVIITDSAGSVIRTLEGEATSGSSFTLVWDGRDSDGNLVPAGNYTVDVNVDDGLGHVLSEQLTLVAEEWFTGTPVDPQDGVTQVNPAASGSLVVWQDDRSGRFAVYSRDLAGGDTTAVSPSSGSQEHPAIDGTLVVWQDDRDGDFDLYGFDLSAGNETLLAGGSGNQTFVTLSGEWIAWQDNRSGNWDIWAKNLASGEVTQITNHVRDQIRPALSGSTLVWEDYRHGLAEIYQYDLVTGEESRLTINIDDQFLPAIDGETIVWTDQRDGQQEIYRYTGSATRLTYGSGNRSQAAVRGNLLVYTDYTNGSADPNLAFLALTGDSGGQLTSHPARQEKPAIGDGHVFWQDDRNGTFQIYTAELEVSELPLSIDLAPGFNLVAVGECLVANYPTAAALRGDLILDRVQSYSAPHSRYFEADDLGNDFALVPGTALILYAPSSTSIELANPGESYSHTLLPGANHIGMFGVPAGFRAFDLLSSVGLDNVISVRRFDVETGLWESAAVRGEGEQAGLIGENFKVCAGEGLVITMKNRVDNWAP